MMKGKGLVIGALAIAGALVIGNAAVNAAGLSVKVRKAFKGQIVITAQALGMPYPSDKQTISKWKKRRLKEVTHTMVDGVPTWRWYYSAFLKKKPRTNMLSFDFYTADKKADYKANKKIGVDPNVTILQGVMSISEDDNLSKGKTYVVKLTGEVRGREVVFARTKITVK
jgi:hypothetical protein